MVVDRYFIALLFMLGERTQLLIDVSSPCYLRRARIIALEVLRCVEVVDRSFIALLVFTLRPRRMVVDRYFIPLLFTRSAQCMGERIF